MRTAVLVLAVAFAAPCSGAETITRADVDEMIEVFETRCLGPLMHGEVPSDEGFRVPRGEASIDYSNSVTRDDRVMVQFYEDRGLWGCGATNSVYRAPADGASYAMMDAALQTYSDTLKARHGFVETSHCHKKFESSWGRSFVSVQEARPGTYIHVMVSATHTYANGGPSLEEHYGPLVTTCEKVQ